MSFIHDRIICFIFFIVFFGCTQKKKNPDYVAKVGQTFVSKDEFLRTYQDVILYSKKVDSPETRRKHTEKLIQKKLLALAGRENNLGLDSVSLEKIFFEEELALREALFSLQISQQIPIIVDSILHDHFRWFNTEVHLRHLFFQNKAEADSVFTEINQDTALFNLKAMNLFRDKELAESGGNLGWVQYNILDPVLEKIAYTMKSDSISFPVRSAYGWHILHKKNERRNVFLAESDFQKQKQWLKRQVKMKEQRILADNYVNELMESKSVVIMDSLVFYVCGIMDSRIKNKNGNKLNYYLSVKDKEFIRTSLYDIKNETLAEFEGGKMTVEDFIIRLETISMDVLTRDILVGFYRILRDIILGQEARNLGLDKSESVRVRRRDAEDNYFAYTFISQFVFSQNKPDNAYHISGKKLNKITDSLSIKYPVLYNETFLDTVFSNVK